MLYYLLLCYLFLCIIWIFDILTAAVILAVWKSVALWTLIREKNRQQINGLYLYSLYSAFQPYNFNFCSYYH
jgi:hypothetical protein